MGTPASHATFASLPAVGPPCRSVLVEDSLAGKIARRWTYTHRYLLARTQLNAVQRLEPIVQRTFTHEWLAGARVCLRFLPGHEEREWRISWGKEKSFFRLRWLPWREEQCQANWGAPIAVMVFKHGKNGGKPEMVRCMSLFIQRGMLRIMQLQGVPLIEMPKGLRDWADRFVRATMEFARQENFRGVSIARAESLYSYHHPWIGPYHSPEGRERELKRIRANIEFYHDQTARNLGFVPEEEWFTWRNPGYQSSKT